jgi:hypothetical protein
MFSVTPVIRPALRAASAPYLWQLSVKLAVSDWISYSLVLDGFADVLTSHINDLFH